MLIEIHILQNHVPSNLNRDDTGSVKDCTFGGVPRARISSQCLKRSIRVSDIFWENIPEGKPSYRSKFLAEELRKKIENPELSKYWAEKVAWIFKETTYSKEDENETEDSSQDPLAATEVILFFSEKEIDELAKFMSSEENRKHVENKLAKAKERKKKTANLAKILREVADMAGSQTVPVALFGRMTQPNMLSDIKASCQVAHAISVNKHAVDFDYFTAVDDLSDKYREDSGSAHIGETEFTSACFYKYISVDYESFLKLLGEDSKAKVLGKSAISALIKAAALTNPTGKQNSFAAHNPPHFIGIEIKDKKVPVNLANAFVKPVTPDNKLSLNDKSIDALSKYAKRNREAFSLPMKDQAHFIFTEEKGLGDEFSDQSFKKLDDLIQWLEKYTGA
ncbi:type I-E CRISPR-associated protein Cas7/Cse4/CasC [Leptospira kirschneri]|uniref:CRISPR-associated protein Cas7/Cse4/CasC, subtype TIGR01869 n=1 Tax=Leptospira kirschneri serovar Bulgarica str. Nikolaevo TaxID=1240687 RepID=M6FAS6_9LEPT|nr:type I-E CRISPR-associated protein Cas7/Cse4/CasC [Leptospira kirschneri]EMK25495.1 CRISPR-associated protein Cas7/Cse4/CasC, subtype TIGR01869 [Leptospira kirschneri serovar Bulgarica str. Nikolaevo]